MMNESVKEDSILWKLLLNLQVEIFDLCQLDINYYNDKNELTGLNIKLVKTVF